jgi:YHS domain-containing protein
MRNNAGNAKEMPKWPSGILIPVCLRTRIPELTGGNLQGDAEMDASLCLRGLMAVSLITLACGCAKKVTEPAPLAIAGYDPVAYFDVGPGKPEFEYEWDEESYRFANAANMARFKAEPGRYAPRFGNNCAGALAFGFALKANPEIWRVREGRLYIFGSPDSRDIFDKDPQRVIAAAERNYDRLRKNQELEAEVALPPELVPKIRHALEQCRVDARSSVYCGSKEEAHLKHVLDTQPPQVIEPSALPVKGAAQP